MKKRKQLLAIVGPTGSGKTSLAVTLANQLNGIIISADSRQVYRQLDVGTNKEGLSGEWQGQPARILETVPQLLIDVAKPGSRFTVAEWLDLAKNALAEIWQQQKLPIVVGGTGLYVSALLDGYQLGQGRLAKPRNPVDFDSLVLIPPFEREQLNQRSDQRIMKVFDQVAGEIKELMNSGVSADWFEKIGLDYSFAYAYTSGSLSREQAIEQSQRAARAYIRRQLTWWRHHQAPKAVESSAEALALSREFLKAGEKVVE